MSPRRRALLLGVGLLLVALLAGLAVALRGSSDEVRAVPQDRPGPVLLVPGYGGSTGSLEVLAQRLRATGRTATVVRLPGDGTGDLRAAARALDAAVTAPSVDVVGYSAGGVVVRLWVKELGGAGRARRVVTLGAPHHGSGLAGLGASVGQGVCPTACQQLVPGSPLLTGLNRGDETPAGPQWLSVWTDGDQTVTPPDSARLAGATDVVLQDLCPGVQVTHSGLPRSPLVTQLVQAALGAGPVTLPTRPSC